MSKLTDKQKKLIISDRLNEMSIRALAKKYNVSTPTIQKVIKSDNELVQKLTHKKEQNTIDVISHMDNKKNEVCGIIDKILKEISDDDKIKSTSLSQLATTMGILIDKFTANENMATVLTPNNNLIEQIQSVANTIDHLEDKNIEI